METERCPCCPFLPDECNRGRDRRFYYLERYIKEILQTKLLLVEEKKGNSPLIIRIETLQQEGGRIVGVVRLLDNRKLWYSLGFINGGAGSLTYGICTPELDGDKNNLGGGQ